jgi:hypothetical protein
VDRDATGLTTGAFLLLVGVWVVSRTIVHDNNGKNLVDRIVEYASGGKDKGGKGDKGDPGFKLPHTPFSFSPSLSPAGTQKLRAGGFGIDQEGPANPRGLLPVYGSDGGLDFGLPLLPHIHVPKP